MQDVVSAFRLAKLWQMVDQAALLLVEQQVYSVVYHFIQCNSFVHFIRQSIYTYLGTGIWECIIQPEFLNYLQYKHRVCIFVVAYVFCRPQPNSLQQNHFFFFWLQFYRLSDIILYWVRRHALIHASSCLAGLNSSIRDVCLYPWPIKLIAGQIFACGHSSYDMMNQYRG